MTAAAVLVKKKKQWQGKGACKTLKRRKARMKTTTTTTKQSLELYGEDLKSVTHGTMHKFSHSQNEKLNHWWGDTSNTSVRNRI